MRRRGWRIARAVLTAAICGALVGTGVPGAAGASGSSGSSGASGGVAPLAGSPARVILGVGYYGYLWPTTSSVVRSSVRPAGRTYGYPGSVTYRSAMPIISACGRLWDQVELGAWTRWQSRACSSCPLTWRQLYIDDAPAPGRKYDLVNRDDLAGVAIWSLGYEGGYTAPTEMLRTKFVRP